jgi:hypothetical protein
MNEDRSYAEAATTALGKSIAGIFTGLIEGGMTREEALEVVRDYAYGLATNGDGEDEE